MVGTRLMTEVPETQRKKLEDAVYPLSSQSGTASGFYSSEEPLRRSSPILAWESVFGHPLIPCADPLIPCAESISSNSPFISPQGYPFVWLETWRPALESELDSGQSGLMSSVIINKVIVWILSFLFHYMGKVIMISLLTESLCYVPGTEPRLFFPLF